MVHTMAYITLLHALCAFFLLASGVLSHMQMEEPSPLRDPHSHRDEPKDYNILTPLHADGSDFACKGYQWNTPLTPVATYESGGTYEMKLRGGATHGGGSCQISLSRDNGITFKVIKSMEGGCPSESNAYPFTIPSDWPAGISLLAWTWFNKIGNREMYMNCAVVNIIQVGEDGQEYWLNDDNEEYVSTGSRDSANSALARLPDLYVANLKDINNCTTTETADVIFDNPGDDVVYGDNVSAYIATAASGDPGLCTGIGRKAASDDSVISGASASPPDSSVGDDGQWHGDGYAGKANTDDLGSSSHSSECNNVNDGQWHPDCYSKPLSNNQPGSDTVAPSSSQTLSDNKPIEEFNGSIKSNREQNQEPSKSHPHSDTAQANGGQEYGLYRQLSTRLSSEGQGPTSAPESESDWPEDIWSQLDEEERPDFQIVSDETTTFMVVEGYTSTMTIPLPSTLVYDEDYNLLVGVETRSDTTIYGPMPTREVPTLAGSRPDLPAETSFLDYDPSLNEDDPVEDTDSTAEPAATSPIGTTTPTSIVASVAPSTWSSIIVSGGPSSTVFGVPSGLAIPTVSGDAPPEVPVPTVSSNSSFGFLGALSNLLGVPVNRQAMADDSPISCTETDPITIYVRPPASWYATHPPPPSFTGVPGRDSPLDCEHPMWNCGGCSSPDRCIRVNRCTRSCTRLPYTTGFPQLSISLEKNPYNTLESESLVVTPSPLPPPSAAQVQSDSCPTNAPYVPGNPADYLPCRPGTFLCKSPIEYYTCGQFGGPVEWTYGAVRAVAEGMVCEPQLSRGEPQKAKKRQVISSTGATSVTRPFAPPQAAPQPQAVGNQAAPLQAAAATPGTKPPPYPQTGIQASISEEDAEAAAIWWPDLASEDAESQGLEPLEADEEKDMIAGVNNDTDADADADAGFGFGAVDVDWDEEVEEASDDVKTSEGKDPIGVNSNPPFFNFSHTSLANGDLPEPSFLPGDDPDATVSILPCLMGPGPVVPEGVSIKWPHPSRCGKIIAKPTTTADVEDDGDIVSKRQGCPAVPKGFYRDDQYVRKS